MACFHFHVEVIQMQQQGWCKRSGPKADNSGLNILFYHQCLTETILTQKRFYKSLTGCFPYCL